MDPAGQEKDALEARMIQALYQFWRGQLERIRTKLEPKAPKGRKASAMENALSDAFWTAEERELLAVLMPFLVKGAETAVGIHAAGIESLGLAIDWTSPHTAAARWARRHSGKLVTQVTDTTRKRIGGLIEEWIETPDANLGDLYRRLQDDFGFSEARATRIAVTETTNSFSGGEIEAARAIEKEGLFEYDKFWMTNRDAIVCFLCEPLHNTSVRGVNAKFETGAGEVDGPALHVNCRCWLSMRPVIED